MFRWPSLRPYAAGVIIATAIVVIVLWLRDREQYDTLITLEPVTESQLVTVFVGGAVERPGVYTLQYGDRIDAALEAAGGLSEEADPDGINRALKLRDEAQVIVPRKGDPKPTAASAGARPAPPTTSAGVAPTVSAGSGAPSAGPLNVNTATATELERLPGVGPRLAQQIVEYRTTNGPFATPGDLAKVRGISDRMVAEWASVISFGP